MIKPYYQEPNIIIYNGDCLNILPEIEDKSIDLIITDPPYSVGVSSSGKKADYGDNSLIKPFMEKLANHFFRIIKNTGAIYINCDWRTYPNWWDVFAQIRMPTNLIVWDYGWIKAGSHYRFTHEFIIFWAMNNHKLTSKSKSDVWKIKPINFTQNKNHPTEKPVGLIKEIFKYSNGSLILDCFLGSGTTARACKDLGRKCIGIEINSKYCDIAVKRLGQEVLELNY